jgi:hypothetical protein
MPSISKSTTTGSSVSGPKVTYPAQRAGLGRGGAPAHRLRPREGADDGRHQLGDDLLGGAAGLGDVGDVEVALLRVGMDMRLGDGGEAGLAQETLDGLLRRLGGRALDFLAHILGARGEPADVERQPARRPVFACRFVGQTCLDQTVSQHLLQVAGSLALHARWDFLGTEFKQKIGHGRSQTGWLARQ